MVDFDLESVLFFCQDVTTYLMVFLNFLFSALLQYIKDEDSYGWHGYVLVVILSILNWGT